MADQHSSRRLAARLDNIRHEISRFFGTPAIPRFGEPPERRLARVQTLLWRAQRALAREPGPAVETTLPPSPEAGDAALAAAAAVLDEAARRHAGRRRAGPSAEDRTPDLSPHSAAMR